MKQDTQPLLIFMHIPKTAGTTFVDILRRQYDQHELREVYPGYQEQLDQLAVAGDLDQWRMVLGHLRYGVHGLLARPSTYLTLLRTPERQVLSHYNHLMNKEVPLHEQIMRESGASLEGFLEHSWARNLQTQYLSGLSSEAVEADPEQALKLAEDHLRRGFSAVGVTERFDEFLLACQHALGWKDILYRRSNTGSTRPCHLGWSSLDTAIIRELQAANRLDQRLYEHANQLLDEHITQVPDFYRRLAAFQEENRRHQLRATSGRRPDGTVKRLLAQVRGMLRLSR